MITKKSKGASDFDLEERILGGPLTFGAAVEGLRVGDEITQVAFAKILGVSRQYLCDVEKGRRLVSPEQATRFAKAFGPQSMRQPKPFIPSIDNELGLISVFDRQRDPARTVGIYCCNIG